MNKVFEVGSDGLLLGACGTGGSVVKLIPPLTIPDEDLQQGLAIVVNAVQNQLSNLEGA